MVLNTKDSTLDVETSGGNDNAPKTLDLIEVLTHSSMYIILERKKYTLQWSVRYWLQKDFY